ncbi:Fe-S cluster assembly sulfur transfer protein SufU [Fructobacillus ficulneus]|uniref:NifU family protein n=1 Tax=Fructobacillus ficulneus TaxID=157463 RepID=A0A0K8MGB8_9LACO|nr:SUF system NifU family Fe-S cluster assembly protein [Fructobacillus ficulneus]GAO99596.1 NifU family protein [Fructobacillus ficulneus]
MTNANLDNLYRQVLIDYAKNPHNYQKPLPADAVQVEKYNPSCGDIIQIKAQVVADTIEDISFDGNGCAISMAAASMLTDLLRGETLAGAKELLEKFSAMLVTDEEADPALGELALMQGVRKFPTRMKCATLASHATLAVINQVEEEQ